MSKKTNVLQETYDFTSQKAHAKDKSQAISITEALSEEEDIFHPKEDMTFNDVLNSRQPFEMMQFRSKKTAIKI